jgi:hypothetical protein
MIGKYEIPLRELAKQFQSDIKSQQGQVDELREIIKAQDKTINILNAIINAQPKGVGS